MDLHILGLGEVTPHTSYAGFNHSTRKEGLDFLKGIAK